MLQVFGDRISADFLGTFPENFVDMQTNPKFNLGNVNLLVTNGEQTANVGPVNYCDADPQTIAQTCTNPGIKIGGVYDFDISSNSVAKAILADPDNATFLLQTGPADIDQDRNAERTTVLSEVDYYFVSNQFAVYGEQGGSTTEFNNQGTDENISVSVYYRGNELTAENCPPISAWIYRTNPIQTPGNASLVSDSLKPGDTIPVPSDESGNFLLTFAIDAPTGFPPESYNDFMMPPYVTNSPSISVRILPNHIDFSQYYDDPSDPENSANDQLTFDVVYQHALRPYYLLYPAMKYSGFDLSNESVVAQHAQQILQVTTRDLWMSVKYMPRTRDLSQSRMTLLRAWCNKVK